MKRFFRWAKFVVLGVLGLVAVLLIVTAISRWWALARLERKIAELRAAGQPVSLADLARQSLPPGSNAATYLRRAEEGIQGIEKEVNAATEADQDSMFAGELTPTMHKILTDAFAAYPNVIEQLQQAGTSADYDPQFDLSVETQVFIGDVMLAHVQASRAAMRVLSYRVSLLLADGQRDQALAAAITMLRLTRHFDHDPLLISFLVAQACRGVAIRSANDVLQGGRISEPLYGVLDTELARHDLTRAYRETLRSERAFCLQWFGEMSWLRATWPMTPLFDEDAYVEAMETMMQAASRPYQDSATRAKLQAMFEKTGPVTALVYPALAAISDARTRIEARLRCLRVLSAVRRHELACDASEPKLKDLGLPPEVITDPYNDQPLHLKKLPEGWLVYSVGSDLKDGGGATLDGGDGEDCGVGPRRTAAKPSTQPMLSGELKPAEN